MTGPGGTWLRWGAAPWTAIEDALARDPVALLPVGAIEAHGPHVSNDTDLVIAEAVADRAAELIAGSGPTVLVAPPVAWAVCNAARPFPGTISIPADVVARLIVEIARELVRHGVRRICMNVHHWDPPHLAAVDEAVAEIGSWPGVACASYDRRSLDDEEVARVFAEGEGTGIRHGGRVETSMVLARDETRVAADVMAGLEPVWVNLLERLRGGAADFREAGGEAGYFGEPAASTRAEGEAAIEYLAAGVAAVALALDPAAAD